MSITINRVYTKQGDAGDTRLAGGQKLAKHDLRIEAYGTVDELNACMGLLFESMAGISELEPLAHKVRRVQHELFDLGGELATLSEDIHEKQILVSDSDVGRLEAEMDELNQNLPTLRSFILPGGGGPSAHAHLARTVCRRAERRVTILDDRENLREPVVRYLNRLSDWIFVVGRAVVTLTGQAEALWEPGQR